VAISLYPVDWPFAIFKVLTGEHLEVQKREKKRRNVTATHPEDAANPLKNCELPHGRASYPILPEKSMVWRCFYGA
jgi:hypothetical protein